MLKLQFNRFSISGANVVSTGKAWSPIDKCTTDHSIALFQGKNHLMMTLFGVENGDKIQMATLDFFKYFYTPKGEIYSLYLGKGSDLNIYRASMYFAVTYVEILLPEEAVKILSSEEIESGFLI